MNARIVVCLGLLGTVVPVVAHADSQAEKEARALNKKGLQLLGESDFVGALTAFQEAYQRSPNVKILLNIGTALRNLGRFAEATDAYERYAADSAADPKKKAEVGEIIAELNKHLGRLHIEVNEPGTRVLVDGKALGGSPQSVTIRVEEGSHTVVAEKQGFTMAAATVTVAAGDERTVELRLTSPTPPTPSVEAKPETKPETTPAPVPPPPATDPAKSAAPAAAQPVARPEPAPPLTAPGSDSTQAPQTRRTWALVTGTIGVLGLTAGTVFGVLASNKWSDAQSRCPGNTCNDPNDLSLPDDARLLGNISTASFLVGGAAIVTAAILWWSAPSEEHPTTTARIRWMPSVGVGAGGIVLQGGF